ncbi:MAG: PIN domain-containing protein [Treponema sp.]|jgi:predicted nucleic acid-binding protein|nr:PIN domain-containing protein [Treponema sp.]
MEVLIDTNVALGVILNNAGLVVNSRVILELAEQKRFAGYISASAITDIFYIARKRLGKNIAREAINHLLHIFYPATVTGDNIYQAFDLEWDDFEDSVQYIVGKGLSVNYIVTKNTQDFTSGSIAAVTPEQFIEIITGIGK